jgi:transposase
MGSKKTKFTNEFRAEAIKLVLEQGYSQTEAGNRLGINPKNLSRWIKERADDKVPSKTKIKLSAEQEELHQLRRENKRLKLERDILKKAALSSNGECNTL